MKYRSCSIWNCKRWYYFYKFSLSGKFLLILNNSSSLELVRGLCAIDSILKWKFTREFNILQSKQEKLLHLLNNEMWMLKNWSAFKERRPQNWKKFLHLWWILYFFHQQFWNDFKKIKCHDSKNFMLPGYLVNPDKYYQWLWSFVFQA